MMSDQLIVRNGNGVPESRPKHPGKTRVASFNRSNVTVTMKMTSLFDRDTVYERRKGSVFVRMTTTEDYFKLN